MPLKHLNIKSILKINMNIGTYNLNINLYGFQLQINLKASVPQPQMESLGGDDDIDAALSDLQITLEGFQPPNNVNSLNYSPELSDYLRFFK